MFLLAFEGGHNKVILSKSTIQCCEVRLIPKERNFIVNKKQCYQEKENECDPQRNFYKNMTKLLWRFKKKNDQKLCSIIIREWNEECIGRSNLKKLCD